MTNQAIDTNTNQLVWVRSHDTLSYRAASTAGVYVVSRHLRGGWLATFEVERGVLRGLDTLGAHVHRWHAKQHPGLGEGKDLAQEHHDARPHATVVPLLREPGIKHNFWPGDGVCWSYVSDQYPGTVTKVTAKSVWVRDDKARRTDKNGQSEEQSHRFIPDEQGEVHRFSVRADGRVRKTKCSTGGLLSHGRGAWRDPSV